MGQFLCGSVTYDPLHSRLLADPAKILHLYLSHKGKNSIKNSLMKFVDSDHNNNNNDNIVVSETPNPEKIRTNLATTRIKFFKQCPLLTFLTLKINAKHGFLRT